jgi:hypothetical protein
MKKFLVVAIALIASLPSFAQISLSTQKTIGTIKNGSAEDVVLSASDKVISIKYMGTTVQNKWNQDFVRFNGGETELNTLYDAFISVIDNDDKNFSLDLTLGENNILTLKKTKVMGASYVTISNGITTTRPLNKSQINKLFGK